jgi:hypothetical protein
MRVGDKLLAIDDFVIKPTTAVDEVRNHLRGEPGTPVSITFSREGVGGGGGDGKKPNEPQTITLQRSVVRIPDVKYFGEFVRCMRFGMLSDSTPVNISGHHLSNAAFRMLLRRYSLNFAFFSVSSYARICRRSE